MTCAVRRVGGFHVQLHVRVDVHLHVHLHVQCHGTSDVWPKARDRRALRKRFAPWVLKQVQPFDKLRVLKERHRFADTARG